MEWLLLIGIIISSFMAFNIAGNDVSNSVGTSVGSGSLEMRSALIMGAYFIVHRCCLSGDQRLPDHRQRHHRL